ncbi:hypothetical protein [Paenibacillus lemnae]|nr:hypothetical protein [Paenibacillus lemnae]
MKKISLVIFLVILIGCSTKEDNLTPFLSDSEGTFMVHLFNDHRTNLENELLEYMNSSDKLLRVMKGIQLYDVGTEDNQLRAEQLEVNNFPTMIITNNKKIIVRTQDIQEVKDFFDKVIQ